MRVLIASLCVAVAFAGLVSAEDGTLPQLAADGLMSCGGIFATGTIYTLSLKNAGETCKEDPSIVNGKMEGDVCAKGTLCTNISEGFGKCVAIKRIGDACASDDECADPNYEAAENQEICVSGKCAARQLGGEDPCVDAKQCLTSACENGKCKFAAIGAECTEDYECGHKASCAGGKCAAFLADGAECSRTTGFCSSATCVQKKGETKMTCQTRSAAGQEFEDSLYNPCDFDLFYDEDSKTCKAYTAGATAVDGECTESADCVENAMCVCGGNGKGKCKTFDKSSEATNIFKTYRECPVNGILDGVCGIGSSVLCDAACKDNDFDQWSMHLYSFLLTGDANSAEIYGVLNANLPTVGSAAGSAPSLVAAALVGCAALMWARE